MINRPNYKTSSEEQYYREFDNIYINLNQSTSLYNSPDLSKPAGFDIQNDSPLLDNASEYYCSVIRFDIPLDGIPILIAPVLSYPNVDPNITEWTIGIRLNGVFHNQNLIYYREYQPQTPPYPVIPTVDNPTPHGPYWFIFEFNTVINMMNIALYNACLSAGLSAPYPYFFLDPVTEIISVVVPTAFTTLPVTPSPFPVPVPNRPEIIINEALFNLLSSFSAYNDSTPGINGLVLLLNGFFFPPRTDNAYYLSDTATGPTAPPTTFIFKEQYPILQEWSDLKDILFVTNRLPINNETLSLPGGFNTTRIPILTDFVPIFTSGKELTQTVYYLPTAQYRLIDMVSTIPLQSFDITIYWRSTYGDIFPIPINIGREVNVKLAFLRKDLYKNPTHLLYPKK